ncbi:MAG: rRNA maturation RNase YbeY [bacterium]
MKVLLGTYKLKSGLDSDTIPLDKLLESICEYLNLPDGDIEITLTTDKEIKRLNNQYRQKDVPTNVLSFPQFSWKAPLDIQDQIRSSFEEDNRPLWGEIILSIETIEREANEQQVNFTDELIRICIHGMLHLFGFSHETEKDYEVMAVIEESAINFSKKWIQHQ